jgi:hypothetical protein
MHRIILTTMAVTLSLGLGGLNAAPLLATDQLEFDFGYAPQNSKVCRIFELRNDGDDTLRITKVIPGCGCTKAPLKDSVLAPGERTELEIIFSTGAYTGLVTKRPRVETNEGGVSRNLMIATNVLPRPDSTYPIQIRPYKLDLSQFGETVRDQMKFTIANVSDGSLGLSLVSFPPELMTVQMPASVPAKGSVQGLVMLTEKAVETSFESSITIQLDDSAKTRFTIPIKRSVKSPVQATAQSTSGAKKP